MSLRHHRIGGIPQSRPALEAEAPPVNECRIRSGQQSGAANGIQESTVDIIVSILVSESSSPEAAADPYEVQIHDALFADRRLGGLATLLQRLGGQWAFDLGDSVSRQITYRYTYRTPINDLDTVADDDTIHPLHARPDELWLGDVPQKGTAVPMDADLAAQSPPR